MEDVINNVRESFLDDGVDEQVLQELKQVGSRGYEFTVSIIPFSSTCSLSSITNGSLGLF